MMMQIKSVGIDKKSILGWALFDFANSSYTTLVVTFIYSTYFVKSIAPDELTGTALWSRGVTITAIVVAILSPFLGALADQGNLRKKFLITSTFMTVLATAALYFIMPGQVALALLCFVISNIAFELTNVFYNAFLPDIAPEDKIGRISGIGWGIGYIGGLLAMFTAMMGFVSPEVPWFGLARESGANIRATCLLVAAWFTLFSIPMFLWVKEIKASPASTDRSRGTKASAAVGSAWTRTLRDSIVDLGVTFKEIRKYGEIVKFLGARLVYNDALVTIFAFGGIYAAGTFGFTFHEIMLFGIVLNIAAGTGAIIMGFFDDRFGGKNTIQVSNAVLACASLLAVVAPDKTLFWTAGILVGLFAGPNQSASRSLLARFVPEKKENQFFGFFAFSGKLTAFMGPLLLGVLTELFSSQRAGVFIVVVLFVAGGLLLTTVDEKAGISAAGNANDAEND